MMADTRTGPFWIWGGCLLGAGLAFLVYLPTLAPTVYGLDSAHLTNAAYTLGLVHPPGYPLYLLLGHLFTRLPFGDVGYRMNLMSACFGALAIGLHYLLLLKLTHRPLASLAAALLLAYSFVFWSTSVMAEVYTLHVFLMIGLILAALAWQEQQCARWLYLLAFVFGLSLTNHLATMLLAPGLLYWLLAANAGQFRQPRRLLALLALFVLGFSLYLYLPLRYAAQPPPSGTVSLDLASWQDLLEVISARIFWKHMFAYHWSEIGAEIQDYLSMLWSNFLGVGLIAGLIGGLAAFYQRRRLFIGLALLYLANLIFFINYDVPDKWMMFLPTYVIWAVWVGLGYDWLLAQAARLAGTPGLGQRWQHIEQGLFLLFVLTALLLNYQYADRSGDRRTYDQASRIFETVAPGANVLAIYWFEAGPLEYLHLVEQRRPDIKVWNMLHLTRPQLYQLLASQNDGTQPFYSTANPAWLTRYYRLNYIEACDCYKIN
jgi:hypothetical protein